MKLIGHHPLAVANQFLDLAAATRLPVTNLALQKLMYFGHGWLLASAQRPLVRGGFQAWEHGPVSRVVYAAFRRFADRPIVSRAVIVDFETGAEKIASGAFEELEVNLMRDVLGAYGHIHPFELSRATHETGSPWHQTWTSKSVIPGMKISDNLIQAHFLDHRFVIKN